MQDAYLQLVYDEYEMHIYNYFMVKNANTSAQQKGKIDTRLYIRS